MGATSWWHWLIVLAVVLLLFGGKKLPELMKGLGTGIKGFKKALKDDDEEIITQEEMKVIGETPKESNPKKPKAKTTKTAKTTKIKAKKA